MEADMFHLEVISCPFYVTAALQALWAPGKT